MIVSKSPKEIGSVEESMAQAGSACDRGGLGRKQ